MLLRFSIENFRSFKDRADFSMVATRIGEHSDEHIVKLGELKVLRTAAIYGANASGKSNLLLGMAFMSSFINRSATRYQKGDRIPVEPFLLSSETEDQPSLFEVTFLHSGQIFTYGFTVSTERVLSEWLDIAGTRSKRLFNREKEEVEFHHSYADRSLYDQLRKSTELRSNALLLPVLAQFGGIRSSDIMDWFQKWRRLPDIGSLYSASTVRKLLSDEEFSKSLTRILQGAGIDVEAIGLAEEQSIEQDLKLDVRITVPEVRSILENSRPPLAQVRTLHKKFDSNLSPVDSVSFSMAENESQGTRKLFVLLLPVLSALQEGFTLFADELDASLHPLLTRFILNFFHSSGKTRGQLIFATHDSNLLDRRIFRRDEIWFAEKDRYGASHIYSLVEYEPSPNKKVRKDASYEKDYLEGRYGAIPFLNSNENLFNGAKITTGRKSTKKSRNSTRLPEPTS